MTVINNNALEQTEEELPTKEAVQKHIEGFSEQVQIDLGTAEDLREKYDERNTAFIASSSNDDGNEDHLETFDEDGDNVRGADCSEQLMHIDNYLESAPKYENKAENLLDKLQECQTQTQLAQIIEEFEDLEKNYEEVQSDLEEAKR